ncbi:MAG: Rpn family recombination-promoting nuclease/putative transposase [Spirochaetes bacterium]|nr:Rpn family recombination-promoting nuclease/putative transposase [Spirochaetota bacterium]
MQKENNKQPPNIHDSFFHEVFTNEQNMKDFLKETLPEKIRSLFDLNKIKYDHNRYIQKHLRNKYSDLVVKTCLTDGKKADVYFLFEHKSYNDPDTWLQIMHYQLLMWQKDKQNKQELRIIIPYVFYHGTARWKLPQNFSDQFSVPDEIKQFIPEYKYLLFDTSKWNKDDPKYQGLKKNIFLITSLLLLKNIFTLELSSIDKIFELWRKMEYIKSVDLIVLELYYVSNTIDLSMGDLEKRIENAHLDKEKIMPTLAERMKITAKIETKQSDLIRLLSLKYGLSESEEQLIKSVTDTNKLDMAIEKIVTSDLKQDVMDALT